MGGVAAAGAAGRATGTGSNPPENNEDPAPRTPPPAPENRPIVGKNPRRELVPGRGLNVLTIGREKRSGDGVQLRPDQIGPTSGHIPRPVAGGGPTGPGQITTTHGANEFTAAEKATLDKMFDGKHYISRSDLDTVAKILNTPEKASAFVNVYFKWVDNHDATGTANQTYSPLEQLRDRLGVCRDQHSFVTWVLRQNGIEAYTVGYGASYDELHAFTVYQRPDKKWAVVDYGWIHAPGEKSVAGETFDSLEDAVTAVTGGNYQVRLYEVSEDPSQRPVDPIKIYQTHVSMEGRRHFNNKEDYGYGPVAGVHAPGDPGFGWGANVRADLNSAAAQVDYGALSVEGRTWYDGDPMLAGAKGVRADLRIMKGLTLSGGVLDLPGAFSYGAGPRAVRNSTPVTGYFVGGEIEHRIFDLRLGSFYLKDDIRLDGNFTYGVNKIEKKLDIGSTQGLSYLDLMTRLETGYESDRFSIYVGANSYNPTLDIGTYFVSGGRNLLKAPVTLTADAGVRYHDLKNLVELRYYQPIAVRTNLYGDKPVFVLAGSTQISPRFRLAASVETGLSKDDVAKGADLGVRWGPLGVSGGVQRNPGGGGVTPRAAASVDVIELGSMIGLY